MEIKTVRIAWNNNGWIKPSGKDGKPEYIENRDYNPFEAENGYGHEEWLFDTSKAINGIQYGFLQPINRGITKHQGREYGIYLYTFNYYTKKRYFVGKMNLRRAELCGILNYIAV